MKSLYRFLHFSPLIGLTFLTTELCAQSAPPLKLSDALSHAAERNPTLAAQRHNERAADGLIEQAGLRPNPTLDVSLENFLGTGGVQGVRGLEATVEASQTLERGGKRTKRVALATRERDIAINEFALARTEVLSSTAFAFIELIAAQERVALAEAPLKLARETLDAVDARVKAGAASPAETARARAAVATARGDLTRAQATLASARAHLAANWGGDAKEITLAAGAISLPHELPEEVKFSSQLSQHPSIALQQAFIESQRASLDLEKSQASQDISVGGGVRFLREGTDAALVAGVSIPLPVRNKNQGNIRAARERVTGAEQKLRAAEIELRAKFSTSWQELKAAHTSAVNLRREVLPATEEAFSIVRKAYDEGQLPLIDVLDAQRALIDVRREILDAEASYLMALVRAEALASPSFALTSSLISKP